MEVRKIDYHEHIEKVIEYIEENLKNDVSISTLARSAGYSEYHFLRVFREVIGLTPADYIRKRRISEIVSHIERDKQPICDLAFEYGFNSKEKFIRAFKAEHHILPTEYKSSQTNLILYEPFKFYTRVWIQKVFQLFFRILCRKKSQLFRKNIFQLRKNDRGG